MRKLHKSSWGADGYPFSVRRDRAGVGAIVCLSWIQVQPYSAISVCSIFRRLMRIVLVANLHCYRIMFEIIHKIKFQFFLQIRRAGFFSFTISISITISVGVTGVAVAERRHGARSQQQHHSRRPLPLLSAFFQRIHRRRCPHHVLKPYVRPIRFHVLRCSSLAEIAALPQPHSNLPPQTVPPASASATAAMSSHQLPR